MKFITTTVFLLCAFLFLKAQPNCGISTSQIDLHANKIKTRLLNSGDLWWDGSRGKYQADYFNHSTPTALSVGGVWMGGFDSSGTLKIAASTYGRQRGRTDYFPGSLSETNGTTDETTCQNWDRFFNVTKGQIEEHLNLWQQGNYTEDNIPFPVKTWPAKGNPFFESNYGFELPNTPQGLADFWDENGDGVYNPLDGDHPALLQRGCDMGVIPDEMIFWIFNDGGGSHEVTLGNPMQMEFHVTAFAFERDNAFDYSTFYKYKFINRGSEILNDSYFGIWADPDLGCHTDDYVGCDSTRNMWYLYNTDATDGQVGCTCPQGISTYCENIPMLGMDFFRGPVDADGNELGMSSFSYYHNSALWGGPGKTVEPKRDIEWYHYLTGKWRDGSPYIANSSFGISGVGKTTKFVFHSPPNENDSLSWSLCTAGLGENDIRIVQSVGPITMQPGSSNELILGVVFVPSIETYPCPEMDQMNAADDFIQTAFDNCLDVFTSVDDNRYRPLESIVLSPNPFSKTNHTELTISNLPQKSTIRIFNINGKLIENIGEVIGNSINWTPDLSLSAGIYFVEVSDENKRKVLKWIYSK